MTKTGAATAHSWPKATTVRNKRRLKANRRSSRGRSRQDHDRSARASTCAEPSTSRLLKKSPTRRQEPYGRIRCADGRARSRLELENGRRGLLATNFRE